MSIPLILADSYGNVLLVVAILVIVAGLFGLWRLSRFAPRGTVLGAATAIYLASFVIASGKTRELHLLVGCMRMLGFAGGILGIVDLFRKRKSS